MKKIYCEWLESNEQVSIRPRWIHVLKSLAEDTSRDEIALTFGIKRNNLDSKLKKLREHTVPILCSIVDDIRSNHLIESHRKKIEKIKEAKRHSAELGLLPGGVPPFGTIFKDGLLFPKPGEYEILLKIFEYYAQGKGPTWLANKFEMSRSKIRGIVRDIRYDKRFMWDGVEREAAWDQLVPKELWNRVQERHRPKSGVPKFGYQWLNGKRVVNPEQAAICKHVIRKYLNGVASSKIMEDEKIQGPLFYSILRDESRTGWISKNEELVPSGYPQIISREDFKEAPKILKSHERWDSLVNKRKETGKKAEAKILSLIPRYRSEVIKKMPKKSPITIKARIKQMKDKKVLQERQDGLLYFYGLPPTDVPMKLTKKQEAVEKIVDLMPAYRWQIYEKLKMRQPTVQDYLTVLKKKDVLKERPDGLLQKSSLPFPERFVETRLKRESEKRRRILYVFRQQKEATRKDLREKTGIPPRTLCGCIQKLKAEGFLEERDRKLRLLDRSVLSKPITHTLNNKPTPYPP